MIEETAHIAIVHEERVPKHIIEGFCAELNVKTINIQKIELPEQGPQAHLEWFVLPAIAVWLLKPYFNSLLTEAAKDHHVVLKKSLEWLWKRVFGRDRELRGSIVTSSGATKPKYSVTFAIYVPAEDGRIVKLLVRDDSSEDECASIIDAFLKFVESYHSGNLPSGYRESLESKQRLSKYILVEYDSDRKSLQILEEIRNIL